MAKLNQHEVTDWSRKRAAITSFAGGGKAHTPTTEVVRFYYADISDQDLHTLGQNLSNIGGNGGRFKSGLTERFFEKVRARVGFSEELVNFFEMKYEEWCNKCSAEFSAHLKKTGAVSSAPSVKFYTPDLNVDPNHDWDQEGAVDQRYMFADRESPALWNDVRQDHTGDGTHPYRHCADTLTSTITDLGKSLGLVEELVLIGAGSDDKDWEIITAIAQRRQAPFRVILCDASFHMLVDEHHALTERARKSPYGKHAHIELCCFDFANRRGWQICGLHTEATRLFCILGGTIGNVDEDGLFTAIAENFNDKSALIVGASFYKSDDDINSNIKADVKLQYGVDAKKIGLISISRTLDKHYPNVSFKQRLELVHCDPMSLFDNNDLPGVIQSRVPGTCGAVFTFGFRDGRTKVNIHREPNHDLIYLFVSRRYIIGNLAERLRGRLKALSKVIDHPKAGVRYSHLVIYKEESWQPS